MINNKFVRFFYCALLTVNCVLSTSCFHKDVMNDRADDVSQSFIYSGKDASYIITQELIFQATSKSSGGGMTRISGYNECRLTSYDLATGAMLGRVEIGDAIDEGCKILGCVNEQIWCYSVDDELGLHSRDPKTLEVVKKENEIVSLGKFNFSRPEWSNIQQYYGYEVANNKLVLTDMQGMLYFFNPANDSLTQTEESMPDVQWSADYLSSSAYFGEDEYVSFSGDGDRLKLMWKYEDTTADLPFLKPEVFIELNERKLYDAKMERYNRKVWQVDTLEMRIDSILKIHPNLAPEDVSWSEIGPDQYEVRNLVNALRRDIESGNRDADEILEATFAKDYALNDKRYTALIYSASTVSDTARAILTCVDQTKPKKFVERWHLDLTSFYFDPDKAEGAGVFDEGDPEFGYRWADIHAGKFVMIAQLQMICVDMATGKKLWEIPL